MYSLARIHGLISMLLIILVVGFTMPVFVYLIMITPNPSQEETLVGWMLLALQGAAVVCSYRCERIFYEIQQE